MNEDWFFRPDKNFLDKCEIVFFIFRASKKTVAIYELIGLPRPFTFEIFDSYSPFWAQITFFLVPFQINDHYDVNDRNGSGYCPAILSLPPPPPPPSIPSQRLNKSHRHYGEDELIMLQTEQLGQGNKSRLLKLFSQIWSKIPGGLFYRQAFLWNLLLWIFDTSGL